MEKKLKEFIDIIIELIQDKQFPARRNIMDYVCLCIGTLDYDVYKEVEKYTDNRWLEIDKLKEQK